MSQGQQWVYDPKNRDAAAQSLIKHKGASPEYAARAIEAYYGPDKVQVPDLKLDEKALNAVVENMKAAGSLPKDQTIDWKKYLDTSYWEEATGKKP